MSEQPTWNDRILASGILVQDQTIMDLIGTKGNVATLPFYVPIDEDESHALNNDGETDNTPTEISGKKQTCMLTQRMKAWKAQDTTLIFAQQKAVGDADENMGLLVLNSYIYARYKAMGLVDYNKYTITNAIERDVELPTIGGFIPVVSDRFTVDTSTDVPIYKSYMIGSGTVLTCDKTNYEDPYYADYDPETKAGIRKLYTKQGYVLHPNGFSINANKIAKESPTNAELGAKANWSLAFNHKNIRMGLIKSNG